MVIDWALSLQILNTIVLVILGLFLRSYLPSYFERKGENKAIKEDTSTITSIEESVRSAISEIRNERDEFLREQRACLLRFYDLSIELYYEKLATNFGDFPIDDGQSLATYQKSFFEKVSELIKSYQRIVVYFDDKAEVRIYAEKLLNQILKARIVMKQYFGKVKLTAIEENSMWKSGDRNKAELVVEASNKANLVYWDAMNPVMVELSEALREYLTSLNLFLRPNEIPQVPPDMFSRKR